jgi:hypothetical protein
VTTWRNWIKLRNVIVTTNISTRIRTDRLPSTSMYRYRHAIPLNAPLLEIGIIGPYRLHPLSRKFWLVPGRLILLNRSCHTRDMFSTMQLIVTAACSLFQEHSIGSVRPRSPDGLSRCFLTDGSRLADGSRRSARSYYRS